MSITTLHSVSRMLQIKLRWYTLSGTLVEGWHYIGVSNCSKIIDVEILEMTNGAFQFLECPYDRNVKE